MNAVLTTSVLSVVTTSLNSAIVAKEYEKEINKCTALSSAKGMHKCVSDVNNIYKDSVIFGLSMGLITCLVCLLIAWRFTK